MAYIVSPNYMPEDWKILVVGCGGTGGYVAEGLCRLTAGTNIPLVLIDYDRVKVHNLRRQHFYESDVGKFKSEALAVRLSRQFNRPVAYSVYPYDSEMVGAEFGSGMYSRLSQGIIIGCVDGPAGRQAIAHGFHHNNWWIDAGNGYSSGQVLIGNVSNPKQMETAFEDVHQQVANLPMPSLQLPSLLAPVTVAPNIPMDCAEAVSEDEQNPVINQAMAMLVLQIIHKLLLHELTWMGVYIDLDAGSMQYVPAEPEVVARMLGMKVESLIMRGCSKGAYMRLPRR